MALVVSLSLYTPKVLGVFMCDLVNKHLSEGFRSWMSHIHCVLHQKVIIENWLHVEIVVIIDISIINTLHHRGITFKFNFKCYYGTIIAIWPTQDEIELYEVACFIKFASFASYWVTWCWSYTFRLSLRCQQSFLFQHWSYLLHQYSCKHLQSDFNLLELRWINRSAYEKMNSDFKSANYIWLV